MSYVRAFVLFWYDFVVGDDWQIAAGVCLALASAAGLAALDIPAWWVVPLSVAALLSVSLMRVARSNSRH